MRRGTARVLIGLKKNTMRYLKAMGYHRARSLKGGINEWVRKQRPTETSAAAKM